MGLDVGSAALVTGGGSGIGRAVAVALAKRGVSVTVAELDESAGKETVRLVEAEHAKLTKKSQAPAAQFVPCDVAVPEQLVNAFEQHFRTFGRMDALLNNAGITTKGNFFEGAANDTAGQWRKVLNVNLVGVVDGTRLGIHHLKQRRQKGVIVNVGSASGLYPAEFDPVYSSSKAGVVMFTRSLRGLKREGIRVNVFCPEFIETNMTQGYNMEQLMEGYVSMEEALKVLKIERELSNVRGAVRLPAIFELFEDESRAGACLWLTKRRGAEYWPTREEMIKYEIPLQLRASYQSQIGRSPPPVIPSQYKKLQIYKLTSDFRSASRIVNCTLKLPVKPGHVLIKYLYAGINASDVNFSAGRYVMAPGQAEKYLPFDPGFEGVGIIAAVGEGVDHDAFAPGSHVMTMSDGCFAEFKEVPEKFVIRVPVASPEALATMVSGLTASISLEQAGRMKSGETVLVTAAAGGTGQFAVQLAKLAGNKVVATCGGEAKAKLLKSLGVDRAIDYRKEDIQAVLKKEFPEGVDLVYESVGGDMFRTCLRALAPQGRIILIGMISQYREADDNWQKSSYPGLTEKILAKSQSVIGFFLNDYAHMWREHLARLNLLYLRKKIKVVVDPRPFVGLEAACDAVEYLQSGQSSGKVVLKIDAEETPSSRL